MKGNQICFLIFCGTILLPASSYAYLPLQPMQQKKAFFIFGDSLLDVGMNNYINTTIDYRCNFWPYGETFFKFPTGRFSDGRLIQDFIAEYAGLPLIPPYLQPGYKDFTSGVNFASGGAGALVETHRGFVVDLKTQLSYFKNVEKILNQKLGGSKTKALLSQAVCLISIGGNDYIDLLTANSSIFRPYSQEEYVGMVIGNLTTVIKGIYDEGGRKFGLINVVPLALIPNLRATGIVSLKEVTKLVKLHNKLLPTVLQKLNNQLKGFRFSLTNVYSPLYQRVKNPSKYGFNEGEVACCGSGPYRGIRTCGLKGYELCDNPNGYVFFDSYHPSEKVYYQFADLMWNGRSNVTWPCSLKDLFS